jgi:dTDP-4-amino-4,6-dideoxygalactose transaminase
MRSMISVFGSHVGPEEMAEVRSSLEAQWMGLGPKVRTFESEFARRLGLNDFAMLDSGSNSLQMAVRLLDLAPGSEVIVPSFTWIACAHAALLCNCVPVFCDVDLASHNMTAETVRPHLTRKTGAVMVVHYGGKPARVGPILALGLPVIEDAAHAVDSRVDGVACGALGTIGVYSFDAVKNLASPDGGGVTARDPEMMTRSRVLRYCGIGKSGLEASATSECWWEYNVAEIFPRFLPNDIAASVALAQLRKLDVLQARRKEIWDLYQREFAELGWLVRPLDAEPGEQHSYFTYCVRVSGGRRNDFAKYLYDRGIYTTLRYHPLHLNPIYRSEAKLPVCEQLNAEAINLPLHPRLSADDVAAVVEAVHRFR